MSQRWFHDYVINNQNDVNLMKKTEKIRVLLVLFMNKDEFINKSFIRSFLSFTWNLLNLYLLNIHKCRRGVENYIRKLLFVDFNRVSSAKLYYSYIVISVTGFVRKSHGGTQRASGGTWMGFRQ